MHTCPKPCAQVGRAGEDVVPVRVPQELIVLRLEECFNLGEAIAELGEHLLHVVSLLHGDDLQVVLLIHPHQEGLIVIVPNATGIGPAAVATWACGH